MSLSALRIRNTALLLLFRPFTIVSKRCSYGSCPPHPNPVRIFFISSVEASILTSSNMGIFDVRGLPERILISAGLDRTSITSARLRSKRLNTGIYSSEDISLAFRGGTGYFVPMMISSSADDPRPENKYPRRCGDGRYAIVYRKLST